MSPGAEFVENHFTDQVFYKDNWKEVVWIFWSIGRWTSLDLTPLVSAT
jgi:hypothetical protein